ncbi:MAG: GNAT family protein [Anaerolineae bacterium]|nr:GNAT family protein [Anaerolineae bacterium]
MLTTSRLTLREFIETDWRAVYAYHTDPRYLRYYPWTTRTETEVQTFVQRFITWQAEDPRSRFQFAIVLTAGQQLIGTCGLRMNQPGGWEADFGYEIAPDHWGHGYATEAAAAMLAYGFETLQLHRISASVIADNTASIRVLEKLGLRHEGTLRQNQWMKGRWWDTLIYAILQPEWRERHP